MRHFEMISAALFSLSLTLAGCGGEITPSAASPESGNETDLRTAESAPLEWWNAAFTSQRWGNGWQDTDLAVSSSTATQLRHPSRLIAHGVYGWGYMPTFVDTVTGHTFRFLHLRPQHQWATEIGHVYPAGFVVGLSGGDTRDTGLGVYSTGAHLCVQTQVDFRTAFPRGGGGGAGQPAPGGAGPSPGAACFSKTLNRHVGERTCVQSSSDGNWYTCEGGSWIGGRNGCGIEYPFCHSATLGRYVPARSCVESKFDHVWYQCNHDGWNAPVENGAGPVGSCSVEYRL